MERWPEVTIGHIEGAEPFTVPPGEVDEYETETYVPKHQADRLEGELAEARRELCKESPQDFNNGPNSPELLKAEEERELELTELREALGAEIERLASSKSVSNWQLADRLRALATKEERS